MEYSKDIILDTQYNEVKILNNKMKGTSFFKKNRSAKFIIAISIMCMILIAVDAFFICDFANKLQSVI